MTRLLLAVTLIVTACAWNGAAEARPVLAEPPEFEPTRTLHVSPFGDDGNDGLEPDRPFRSISAAAQAVQPGDLVFVRGGTYFEHVHLTEAGTEERPIVFRAAPGETALVLAGVQPEGWERVPGTRFGYAAPHPTIPNYVMDERFLAKYAEVQDFDSLDEMPGSYMYDEDAQTLAVHSLRSLPPEEAGIRVIGYTVGSGVGAAPGERGYRFDKGFWTRAQHIRVEGFHVAFQPFGIQLRASYTEAWGNTVYGCAVTGVQAHSGTGVVLANNVAFLNDGSGVHVNRHTRGARILGNVSWGNTQRGPLMHRGAGGHQQQVALYGRTPDPTFEGNLAVARANPFERGTRLWRFKSAAGSVVTRRNTLIGGNGMVNWGERALYAHNTVVGGELRVRGGRGTVNPETAEEANSEAKANLYLRDMDGVGFADPARRDFRLRADSPHLGSGAWPEAAPVRYVSPDGDDQADGVSPSTPWRTVARAAAAVPAGGTVYVMEGTYTESVTISARGEPGKPVEFLTYGWGRAVFDGGGRPGPALALRGAAHVKVDGFTFRNYGDLAVEVSDAEDVALVDNVFDGAETAVEVSTAGNVTVENATFAYCGSGVSARGALGRLVLRNNLFVRGGGFLADLDAASREALVSERNAFAGPHAQRQLEAWRGQAKEGHPSVLADVDVEGPDYLLPPLSRYGFAGLGRKPLGARGAAPDESEVPVEEFRVRATPELAVVTWRTPHDYANATVSWRGADGETRSQRVSQSGFSANLRETRHAVSLEDLAPGAEYEVSLEVRALDGRTGSASAAFATPETYRGRATLYVSPQGDDDNDGLSPRRPVATLSAAAIAAVPGDTILVAPGVYRETMSLACGGMDEDRRLTVRSVRPGEAVVDMGQMRSSGFDVDGVNHVTLDGFRITGMMYSNQRSGVSVRNAEDVEVTNFRYDRRDRVTVQLIDASRVRGLNINNNLFQSGFNNIRITHGEDVTVDRNTFYTGGVASVRFHGPAGANLRVTNNIFSDASDGRNPAVFVIGPRQEELNLTVAHNLYHRDRIEDMDFVGFRRGERAGTVEELRERFGVGQGDRAGDPMFLDAENGDFRLAPDSPARGMASDGGDVGMQDPPAGP